MSITAAIESLYADLKAKIGTVSADLEAHFANFLGSAKEAEAAHEAKIEAEIADLTANGYIVTKAPGAVIAAPADAAAPTQAADTAAPAA